MELPFYDCLESAEHCCWQIVKGFNRYLYLYILKSIGIYHISYFTNNQAFDKMIDRRYRLQNQYQKQEVNHEECDDTENLR